MCGGEGEVEEQSDLQDSEGWLCLGQHEHQSCGQTDSATLGLPAHSGGLQQELKEVQIVSSCNQYLYLIHVSHSPHVSCIVTICFTETCLS